jgi:adenylate kinase family enzyme
MRVLVIGTSGSGKSTFANRLAQAAGLTHVELDVLNWRPGWYDRSIEEPDAFLADVKAASDARAWVMAGNYAITRPIVLPRVTHLVWLDLPLLQVMRQVVIRSLKRAASGRDVFPGCKENWGRLLDKEHPIRWALATHHSRRPRQQAVADLILAKGGEVLRCTNQTSCEAALQRLVDVACARSTA